MEPRHGAQPQERGAGGHRLEPWALPWAAAQRRLLPPRGGLGGLQALLPWPGQVWVLLLRPKFILLVGHLVAFFYSKTSPVGEAGSGGDGSKAGTRVPEVLVSGLSY